MASIRAPSPLLGEMPALLTSAFSGLSPSMVRSRAAASRTEAGCDRSTSIWRTMPSAQGQYSENGVRARVMTCQPLR